nr:DUF1508 domain-containing protein [Nitrosomonas nitrosa]
MTFWIYKDLSNQWRWRLRAANNRIVADSAESYWNKTDCLSAIDLVKSAWNAPVHQA